MAFPCPHCGETMYTRSSRSISLISRETYHQCSNVHCGHIATSINELIYSTVPANFPNPACTLPVIKPSDPRPPDRTPDAQFELTL